jgi:hypothetical protein
LLDDDNTPPKQQHLTVRMRVLMVSVDDSTAETADVIIAGTAFGWWL